MKEEIEENKKDVQVYKKTVVYGASTKSNRYSNIATIRLARNGHEVVPIGGRPGEIEGIELKTGHPELKNIDTITVYMNAARQEEHIDYLLGLKPKRIIFNPGAENPSLAEKARNVGIEVVEACTLVMLSTDQY